MLVIVRGTSINPKHKCYDTSIFRNTSALDSPTYYGTGTIARISMRTGIRDREKVGRNGSHGEGKYANYQASPCFLDAFSLRLHAGDSRDLRALVLALPVQRALS